MNVVLLFYDKMNLKLFYFHVTISGHEKYHFVTWPLIFSFIQYLVLGRWRASLSSNSEVEYTSLTLHHLRSAFFSLL